VLTQKSELDKFFLETIEYLS
jgi:hypothetical protein